MSDRIRVTSIVGRFLEHSRLWYFLADGHPEYYIGSADWMVRNFDRRVEAVVPIEDPALHPRLQSLLETCLRDNRQSWELRPDGTYVQRHPQAGEEERSSHILLMRDPWGLVRHSGSHPVMLEPAEQGPQPRKTTGRPRKRPARKSE